MAHTHGPAHAPTGSYLTRALLVTLAFALVEALGGWWAGSLALLGDAGHMVTDSTALGLAALADWVARRPPSERHSYGLGRAEVIAALVNAVAMLALVGGITVAAIQRLRQPAPVAGGAVITLALLGLVVNLLVAWMLSRGEQTLNARAAMLHVLGDLAGSLAALLAGLIITFTGWTAADPLLSLLICVLILYSTMRLLREALHVLMEGVPLHLDMGEVGSALAAVQGVASVHDLHIWTLSSGRVALSAHIVLRDMAGWPPLLTQLRKLLHDRYQIAHVTLQPEPIAEQVHPLTALAPRPPHAQRCMPSPLDDSQHPEAARDGSHPR